MPGPPSRGVLVNRGASAGRIMRHPCGRGPGGAANCVPTAHGGNVKRILATLALVVLPVIGFTPPANAVGYGGCTIVGSITFATSDALAATGTWAIGPAVLDCQGIVGKRARIIGRGPFRGRGTFTALAPGGGACLRQSGVGNVEYEIPTASGIIKVNEGETHTLAGAGVLETPTLHGLFQLPPPYTGDCVTKPLSRATFVAQLSLYRYPREFPPPVAPPTSR